jgi:Paired amphipathic helix repeat
MRDLRIEDAILYLEQVRLECVNDRPHIYSEFLAIMHAFKLQQMDMDTVIRRVTTLFQGNPQLLVGFNVFLPQGHAMEPAPTDSGDRGSTNTNSEQVHDSSSSSSSSSVIQGPSLDECKYDTRVPACVICLENAPICAAIPCMHMSYCVHCARKLCFGGSDETPSIVRYHGELTCPVCRQDVHAIKRVHRS